MASDRRTSSRGDGFRTQSVRPGRRHVWPWLIGGAAALLATMGILSTGSPEQPRGRSVQSLPPTEAMSAVPPQDFFISTPASSDKFEFTVTGVEAGVSSVGDGTTTKHAVQGQFVIVSVEVKNSTDRVQLFDLSNQKLLDRDGQQFEPDLSAQLVLDRLNTSLLDGIGPEDIASVKLVYDIPYTVAPAAVELHDSLLSSGVKVWLESAPDSREASSVSEPGIPDGTATGP